MSQPKGTIRVFKDVPRSVPPSWFEKLVEPAVKAILEGGKSRRVVVRLHRVTKWPKGFPVGLLTKVGDATDYSINSARLLNWLHDNGYTNITPQSIRNEYALFANKMKGLNSVIFDPEDSLLDLGWADDLDS